MKQMPKFPVLVTLLALGACVTTPSGPSVMVLPGTGKTFDQFRADDGTCQQYAAAQVGGQTPDAAASGSGVRSAAVGTILGAAAGAAIDGGRGASVGAGSGLALGGLTGTEAAEASSGRLQQRYDFSYQQCMYAQGHRIPAASGGLLSEFFHGRQGGYYSQPPPPPPSGPPQK